MHVRFPTFYLSYGGEPWPYMTGEIVFFHGRIENGEIHGDERHFFEHRPCDALGDLSKAPDAGQQLSGAPAQDTRKVLKEDLK